MLIKKINNYDIIDLIISKDYANVYKGFCNDSKVICAIKLEKRNVNLIESNYSTELDHKNIIKCLEVCNVKLENIDYKMIVTEWADSGNLSDFKFKSNHKIIFLLTKDILKGLIYLHSKKLVHGDLKPQNILLTYSFSENRYIAKISDYSSKINANDKVFVTPEYAAPEHSVEIGYKYDIWSFGCMLHEFFLLKLPFGSRKYNDTISEILDKIKNSPLNREIFQIPNPYRFIISKCLQKKSNKRFSNFQEVYDVLTAKNYIKRLNFNLEVLKAVLRKEII